MRRVWWHRTKSCALRLPDHDRLWLAAGAQWAFAPDAALDSGIAHPESAQRNVVRGHQETATSGPRGTLMGQYESGVTIVRAQ